MLGFFFVQPLIFAKKLGHAGFLEFFSFIYRCAAIARLLAYILRFLFWRRVSPLLRLHMFVHVCVTSRTLSCAVCVVWCGVVQCGGGGGASLSVRFLTCPASAADECRGATRFTSPRRDSKLEKHAEKDGHRH